jgi:hypothetical protein
MAISQKDQIFQETFEHVALTVDGLGRRIDIGIMGVVLYLNLHGVSTTASCEGHLDWGQPFPWVWIDAGSSVALRRMVEAFDGSLEVSQLFDDTLELTCSVSTLPEKQAEMVRFAEFLRDRFFEEGEN